MGKGVTQDTQKQALLLHIAGLEVQDIYYTLVGDNENKTYDETVTILNDYFTPKQNVPFERHLFRQIVQTSEETMDQFVCRLRIRASTCEYENDDEAIRDQIIDRCYSNQLRRKVLEKDNLDLKTALDIALAYEAVCNICGPTDGAYFVSGRWTMFMYDVPNKREIDCVSQRQQTSSFHGVSSGIILEITPVVNPRSTVDHRRKKDLRTQELNSPAE